MADARDPVAAVHAVLARARTRWLLVFDNATDLAAVQRVPAPGGDGAGADHDPEPALAIRPGPRRSRSWTPRAAARFLDQPGPEMRDRVAAEELAARLGGLPLALEQAAAYMQATGTPLARYLPLFRARQADLLARGEAAGHRRACGRDAGPGPVPAGSDAPAAAGLLRLLAFLAPEPVPLDLLLAGRTRRNS